MKRKISQKKLTNRLQYSTNIQQNMRGVKTTDNISTVHRLGVVMRTHYAHTSNITFFRRTNHLKSSDNYKYHVQQTSCKSDITYQLFP